MSDSVADQPVTPRPRLLSRRNLIRASFGTALTASIAGAGAFVWDFLWPRRYTPSYAIKAGNDRDYLPGARPRLFVPAEPGAPRFYVLRLSAEDTTPNGGGGGDGLIALGVKCTHLGCTVPYLPTFQFNGAEGWFRCVCHGSTYTRAGVRVFGSGRRSLDTFKISFDRDGQVTVNVVNAQPGAADNPSRAVKLPRA